MVASLLLATRHKIVRAVRFIEQKCYDGRIQREELWVRDSENNPLIIELVGKSPPRIRGVVLVADDRDVKLLEKGQRHVTKLIPA